MIGHSPGPRINTEGTDEAVTRALSLNLPAELFEAIADKAAEIVRRELRPDPYLKVEEAAAYLACPPSRIYALVSAGRIPHHRDGSRLLFRHPELDAWIRNGGAKRP